MKKLKLVMLIGLSLIFVNSLVAGSWKNAGDYKAYKLARDAAIKADIEGNTTIAIVNYIKAADLAAKSATVEIQAYQLNNAGYCLIKKFRTLGNKIENINLLKEALTYLEKAKELNVEKVIPKIDKNIDFCEFWINSVK